MTTKKLKDAKLAASKTANTTPKAAPKKKPSKAEQERVAEATAILNAKASVLEITNEQVWIDEHCRTVQSGDLSLLTLGVFMNERYNDECEELGFEHWTVLTEENIPNTVWDEDPIIRTAQRKKAKDLLKRIERDESRIKKSLYKAYLDGKGGSSNTNKELGKIRQKSYKAIYGSMPRRPKGGEYSTLINAGKAAYKKLVNLEAQTEAQAKDASVIGGMLTHFKVDLTKINVNGNG